MKAKCVECFLLLGNTQKSWGLGSSGPVRHYETINVNRFFVVVASAKQSTLVR